MTSSGTSIPDKQQRSCNLRNSCPLRRATKGFTDAAHSGGTESVSALSRILRVFVLLLAVAGATGCAKKITVPSLATQDLETAKTMLASQKLKTGNIIGAPGVVPPGAYVVNQNPAPGQLVPANTPIDLTVEVPVTVPDFTNSSLPDAVNTLQSIGLKVMLVKQPSSSLKLLSKPKVVQQYPPANSTVHHDMVVTLTVTAPPDVGALLGLVTKEPAYQKLNPEYRNVLDAFLK
jgi:beta-lactam-binding protein with PASTA domain